MKGLESMSEKQDLDEMMNDWGFSVNARINFNNFISAVETEKGLIAAVQKIYQIIDDIVLKKEVSQFKTELPTGTKCYRARIIDSIDDNSLEKGIGKTLEGKFLGYNEINSREPVLGISGNGRNNIVGVSYLYVASNPETACMETKSQFGDLISLAEFELTKSLSIIDFASEKTFQRKDTELYGMSMGVFFSELMLRFFEPVRDENAYRATQIISDYLRKTGVDGIKYRSFLSPGGWNFTIFNSHPSYIKFCESRVLIHKQANHSFWDFNNDTEIMSNRDAKLLAYEQNIAEKHKKHLCQKFRTIKDSINN